MFEIYINNNLIILTTTESAKQYMNSKECLVSLYRGKVRYLFQYIDLLEKSKTFKKVVLHHEDIELLKDDFFDIYINLEAAGGAVFNKKRKVLMIFRKGHWDMAKGHMEKGETKAETAVREVQEETGLKNIELGDFIMTTYHTYKDKNKLRCMKTTHWFEMSSNDKKLKAQKEEGIEKVIWMPLEQALVITPIFKNIRKVLDKVIEK